jgi:hypothetical protein
MNVPASFTPAEIAALKAANPGTVLAAPLAANETVPADVPPPRVLGWLDIVGPALEAGETLLLPGPIGIILSGLTKDGIGVLQTALSGAAVTERWTPEKIQNEMGAGLVLPKT